MTRRQLLKKDLFGEVWQIGSDPDAVIVRDTRPARWWTSAIARFLLRREICALSALADVDNIPKLIDYDRLQLTRSFMPGTPLYVSRTVDPQYYAAARRLLHQLHRRGVAHNDLAKEPNLLVLDNGQPAFVDFQLATLSKSRGWFFRTAAREDLRHLLKHKRSYRPDLLTARECGILESPTRASRIWMSFVKPIYVFVTRRVFGWADREGAADRGKLD